MEGETKQKIYFKAVVAVIVVEIILVLGWYLISNIMTRIEIQRQISTLSEPKTGSSTEIADIQADLDNLDMNALDQ
jgi:hypothetical protein